MRDETSDAALAYIREGWITVDEVRALRELLQQGPTMPNDQQPIDVGGITDEELANEEFGAEPGTDAHEEALLEGTPTMAERVDAIMENRADNLLREATTDVPTAGTEADGPARPRTYAEWAQDRTRALRQEWSERLAISPDRPMRIRMTRNTEYVPQIAAAPIAWVPTEGVSVGELSPVIAGHAAARTRQLRGQMFTHITMDDVPAAEVAPAIEATAHNAQDIADEVYTGLRGGIDWAHATDGLLGQAFQDVTNPITTAEMDWRTIQATAGRLRETMPGGTRFHAEELGHAIHTAVENMVENPGIGTAWDADAPMGLNVGDAARVSTTAAYVAGALATLPADSIPRDVIARIDHAINVLTPRATFTALYLPIWQHGAVVRALGRFSVEVHTAFLSTVQQVRSGCTMLILPRRIAQPGQPITLTEGTAVPPTPILYEPTPPVPVNFTGITWHTEYTTGVTNPINATINNITLNVNVADNASAPAVHPNAARVHALRLKLIDAGVREVNYVRAERISALYDILEIPLAGTQANDYGGVGTEMFKLWLWIAPQGVDNSFNLYLRYNSSNIEVTTTYNDALEIALSRASRARRTHQFIGTVTEKVLVRNCVNLLQQLFLQCIPTRMVRTEAQASHALTNAHVEIPRHFGQVPRLGGR